ncbi:zinc ribbon domain-containing protein [bacterium]|nr:zinc ribbon domain-containing protein [bacterium]
MPVYEYEHVGEACSLGAQFEHVQSIKDDALTVCPKCGRPVKRLISLPYISTPKGDSDLKGMGFTKLVKRDTGVYENVTQTGSESRYMEAGKPETMPHIHKKVSD